MAWHRSNETSKQLDTIPGVGPALATALVASIGDPKAFRSGRDFSAWIGLVPKQNSSGGKDKLGSISKQGPREQETRGAGQAKNHSAGFAPIPRRPSSALASAASPLALPADIIHIRGEGAQLARAKPAKAG